MVSYVIHIELSKDFQYVLKQWKLLLNFLKQKQLAFTSQVNRNRKKLTVSRKKAKILTVNRKSHYPIETLCTYNSKKKEAKGNKIRLQNSFS